jgi:hypothetical protein
MSLIQGHSEQASVLSRRASGAAVILARATASVATLSLLSGCGTCVPQSGFARDVHGNLIPKHECPPEGGDGPKEKFEIK